MVCPYCGKEMKQGYLQSGRPFFWGPDRKSAFFIASEDEEFTVSKGFWTGSSAAADFCPDCKKIVISLEEEAQ